MSLRDHPIAAQRERNARIQEHAERVAQARPAASHHGPVPVIIVPANTRATEPLPPSSRAAFLERLAVLLAAEYAVVREDASGSTPRPATPDAWADDALRQAASALDTDVVAVLGHACATCRGECCTAGGNHAFLRGENLTQLRKNHPTENAASLLAQYTAHLPVRHYRGSCVYHTTSGCALPRALRADLCNRYVCGGLTQLKSALAVSGGMTAYVGAADTVHLRRLAVVTAVSAAPVGLS